MASPSARYAGGWWLAVAGAFGYLVVLLSFHLDRFPGVHGDEAWTGLFALRLASVGLDTLRAMNSYSGPLFAWLVSWIFHVVQPGVASLRVLGVAANACAVLILLVHFGRRFGIGRAFGWLLAIATTPMFLLKWRVAWEVYALQNLMIALLTLGTRDHRGKVPGYAAALGVFPEVFRDAPPRGEQMMRAKAY